VSNLELIAKYFKTFFQGKANHAEVRNFLTDDFHFKGPLMAADSAEDYVAQLTSMGEEMELYVKVRSLIGQDDQVAALVDFKGPAGDITYAQWFTLRHEKISRLEVVYDPRSFLPE
jgi:hypothetical protein